MPRSSRSTWRYRITAGPPAACGSLAIFNSSGETGWNPTPADTSGGKRRDNATTITAKENTANEWRIDMAHLTRRISACAHAEDLRRRQRPTDRPDSAL